MAFNGSGTYNLPAGNPVVTGTTISSSTTNTTNSDIATALTNCITRDGQSTPSANLPMNANKLTGLAAGTAAGDSVRYEQVLLLAGGTMTGSVTLVTPVLGTPSSGSLSSCTDAIAYGIKSATTTVSVSGATAPTAGQALIATSSTAATWQTPSAGGFTAMQVFTSSGTFTIPSGKTTIKVTVVGGGGGGSVRNAVGTNGNTSSVASGTQSITTISATGGSGGGGNTVGGIGGVGSNGDINFYGSSGGSSPSDPLAGACGNGGSSFMGGGGAGSRGGITSSVSAGGNYGSGGGGGNDGATGSSGGGGGGTAIKYLTSVTSGNTLSVTIGASAAGGTNGTQSGGAGAAGVVIIEY